MPKRIPPLTDIQVKNAKLKKKEYKLSDGLGLHLLVTPSGGKLWRMQYRFGGKQKCVSFGSYPAVSLKGARDARDHARQMLKNGIDPSEVKKAQKVSAASKKDNSFEVVARAWHTCKIDVWSESHANTTLSRLEKNIFPWLGSKAVDEIRLSDIKPVLHRIEERAPELLRPALNQESFPALF